MQTTRDAMTYEWAAGRVIETMGAPQAGYLIGRSESLIYAWSDASRPDATPNIRQAEVLDKECYRLRGERPFLQVYAARCGLGNAVLPSPLEAFHGWLDGGADLTHSFLAAIEDGSLTLREAADLIKKARKQKANLEKMEKALAKGGGG